MQCIDLTGENLYGTIVVTCYKVIIWTFKVAFIGNELDFL